ncbi:AAA family ATPase [Castellaniella sp.]|uniref:nucleotide-binding protein n=1 Tax=Castellaniella sp. TaxID=1955812 RepID=UPI002AFE5429|nr:AAA family ATPase [Castellaniella sp.]
MRAIVIASQKGGAGKTTLAAHLAVAAEVTGAGPVVLIDTDPQGSLSDWWNSREQDTPVLAAASLHDLPAKLVDLAAGGFKLSVIDTPPAITDQIASVIGLADLVVIPVRPSPHDLRAIGQTVDLAQNAGKPFVFVVMQAKPNARMTTMAIAALSELGPVASIIITDRVDFAASMVDGQTVVEVGPAGKSASEIQALFKALNKHLKTKDKVTKKGASDGTQTEHQFVFVWPHRHEGRGQAGSSRGR